MCTCSMINVLRHVLLFNVQLRLLTQWTNYVDVEVWVVPKGILEHVPMNELTTFEWENHVKF